MLVDFGRAKECWERYHARRADFREIEVLSDAQLEELDALKVQVREAICVAVESALRAEARRIFGEHWREISFHSPDYRGDFRLRGMTESALIATLEYNKFPTWLVWDGGPRAFFS